MRHATAEDLDRLEPLLIELRGIGGLTERKRGYFSRRSSAFVHFHEDGGDLYVDVKLGGDFERMPVTSAAEQRVFLRRVRQTLRAGSEPRAARGAGGNLSPS